MRLRTLAGIALAAAVAGCATYQDDLQRSQKWFEQNQYERALALLRVLEPDVPSHLSTSDQARYAYLRGMTDLRIGYRLEARHWLSVAAAIEAKTPNSLPADWSQRLGEQLKGLNEEVFGGGSLTNHAGDAPGNAKAKATQDGADDDSSSPAPSASAAPSASSQTAPKNAAKKSDWSQ